ncbi:MAG: hypothetical protein Fur005_38860 [Roseiflexaceae bacterium]
MNNHAQRLTLGVLVSIFDRHQPFWLGAVDAALAHDINLICFVGGTIPAIGEPQVESFFPHTMPAVSFFELVNTQMFDGLITWAGNGVGIGMHLTESQMNQFIAPFRTLPIVNFEGTISGIPRVFVDTYRGMCALFRHLIEEHGCKRIAFIRGPSMHVESEERYRAYCDTLAEYGLPFQEVLASPPSGWGPLYGTRMVERLFDRAGLRPGEDIDAIVTSEIDYATGALQALQARGIRVPDQLLLASFNDHTEAQIAHPPITVMQKPFYDSGACSVQMLLDLIQHGQCDQQVTILPRLIIRRSCGCWSLSVEEVTIDDPQISQDLYLARHKLAQQFQQMVAAEPMPPALAQLIATLIRVLQSVSPAEAEQHQLVIWRLLEQALQEPPRIADLVQWQRLLAELLYLIDAGLMHAIFADTTQFWRQIRILIVQEVRRAEATLKASIIEDSRSLLVLSQEMMSSNDIEDLLLGLARRLPDLGITGCYLSIYEDKLYVNEAQYSAEWSFLMLALHNGQSLPLPLPGQRFRSNELIPPGILPPDRAHALIATPLHFGQHIFGIALFEVGPHDGPLYVLLAQEISSAIQSVLLLRNYRQAEHARRESEARMHTLIEHMPVEFWAKDLSGAYIMQNSALRTLMGNNLGRTIDELAISDTLRAKWRDEDQRAFAGETISTDYTILHEGRERSFHQVIAPVRVDGQITAIMGIMFDITQQKQLEASLRQAKEAAEAADRAKSIFLANMSHELRTPLHRILGYAQILQQLEGNTAQQYRGLNAIQKSGEHLLILINDILDLAKFEVGKIRLNPQPYRLRETIVNACDMLRSRAETKQITLWHQIGLLPQIVFGDDQRLRQILVNLLDNAIKFTNQGGVTLTVAALDHQFVHFEVTDTGIGIAREHLDLIFAPFEQVSTPAEQGKGSGLGLAIAHELVNLMGSTLYVESTPGQGSRFWFDLLLPEVANATQLRLPEEEPAEHQPPESWQASIAPSVAILNELIELARIGDIDALQHYLAHLRQAEPDLAAFVGMVAQLAETFQINLLLSYLETQREALL